MSDAQPTPPAAAEEFDFQTLHAAPGGSIHDVIRDTPLDDAVDLAINETAGTCVVKRYKPKPVPPPAEPATTPAGGAP